MPKNPQAAKPFPSPISLSGYQTLSGTCSEQTGVGVAIGNLTKTLQLFNVPALGLPLSFTLNYNAQETVLDVLGHKWRHTYMQSLVFNTMPPTQVTWIAEGAQQFTYTGSDSTWNLVSGSRFTTGVLSPSGSNWLVTFPNGAYYEFDSSGVLTSIVDGYGNTLTMGYTSGLLTSITEPTGRQITLAYTSGLLTSVTDPNSNEYTLSFDTVHNLLTEVMGPDGCTISYAYSTPSNALLTSSTDANSHTWSYTYNGSNQLLTVTSPEATENEISYAYDTVNEVQGEDSGDMTFNRTTLTDARGNTWEYRFDNALNLWRVIDPLGHQYHTYWDDNQRLLYSTAPFAPGEYNKDNTNNRFWRSTYDTSGNRLLSIDSLGRMTPYTYTDQNQLASLFPGQGQLGIQGDWTQHFGQDGYVMCAFGGTSGSPSDIDSLPAYIGSVSQTGTLTRPGIGYSYLNASVPLLPDTQVQGLAYWSTSSSFDITIDASTSVQYNLSLYLNSADIAATLDSALFPELFAYYEQTGREVTLTVTDAVGTQSFVVYNDAPGAWVTFPVTNDTDHPVTVTVAPSGANTGTAQVAVLAFDPYDNHQSTFTYNDQGDMLTATDALGNTSTWTYNDNGTTAFFTDARSNTTYFYYEDSYDNLTRIVDAGSNTWHLTYDLNGNVLTLENPLSKTWTCTYDGKNRLLTATDPLSNESQWEYDGAGNLTQFTDANSKATTFSYSPSNRLTQITDAASGETTFGWDGSGNLITFQTPNDVANSTQTSYQWDTAERMTLATLGQSTSDSSAYYAQIGQAYDALSQLRAMTPPNGMQSLASLINLTGAQNWLTNPGMERPDPLGSGMPQHWTPGPGVTAEQDTTVHRTGTASLYMEPGDGDPYVYQEPVYVRAGETVVASGFMASNNNNGGSVTRSGNQAWFGLVSRAADSTLNTVTGPGAPMPGSNDGWQSMPQTVFQVPGDGQFPRFPVEQFQMQAYSSGSNNLWFDDVALNSVSPSVTLALDGRPTLTTAPSGGQRAMVYDRFGRLIQRYDPNGNAVTLAYDGNNQVLSIQDALGNTTTFEYDAVGNLTQVTDALSNATQYTYDELNRLETITYPDSTTEGFTYDAVGRLYTYTNARGQSRTFGYDYANRLTSVTYATDSTVVSYTYDNMTHVHTRTDRNGDVTTFTYDNLYRVTEVQRVPGMGSPTVGWTQDIAYDADGNRTSFSSAVTGETTQSWSVPSGGYDVLDRLVTLEDRFSNSLTMAYDVDSNRTTVSFPYGTPPPRTTARFDVDDRLVGLDTFTNANQDYLPLSTAYDPASQRRTLKVGGDHVDYTYDADGQLIQENINRLVEQDFTAFQRGTLAATLTSSSSDTVSLVEVSDTFSGTRLQMDRWRLALMPSTNGRWVGWRMQQNDGLAMAFPRWPTTLAQFAYPPIYETVSSNPNPVWGGVEHRIALSGDFDIQVDFSDYQSFSTEFDTTTTAVGMMVADQAFELAMTSPANNAKITIQEGGVYNGNIYASGSQVENVSSGTGTDTSGKFRITRSSSTVTLYYWDNGTSSWTTSTSYSSFTTGTLRLSLYMKFTPYLDYVYATGIFQNFQVNGDTPNYPSTGTYTSAVYDAGGIVPWTGLTWSATIPSGATLAFQVAVANNPCGPFTFVGPDGTSGTFLTTSGTALPTLLGRYFRYQATLGLGTSSSTPVLSRVDATYAGTNASTAALYSYDAVGNLVSVTTDGPFETVTDVRSDGAGWSGDDDINDLNQVLRRDLTIGGVNTTWRFTYDDSGNCLTKSAASDAYGWEYTWDEDNRLLQAESTTSGTAGVYNTATYNSGIYGEGTSTIGYTYDALGRMMTRTDGSGTTTFCWDGWSPVMEFGPDGTQTRYYVIDGELLMFERTPPGGSSTTYQVLSDHTGSVRKVLDSSNTVVASFDYDAWGQTLSSSWDSVPYGGCMYRFVGALGIRWDPATSLYYIRQRWYDPSLARFLSCDSFPFANRYTYAANAPTGFIDLFGFAPSGLQSGANANNLNGMRVHQAVEAQVKTNLSNDGLDPDTFLINQKVNTTNAAGQVTGYKRPDYADPLGTTEKSVIDLKTTNPKAVSAGHRSNNAIIPGVEAMDPANPAPGKSHVVSYDRNNPDINAAADEICSILKRGRGLKGFIGGLHSILGWLGLVLDVWQAKTDIERIQNGTAPTYDRIPYSGDPNGTGRPILYFDPLQGGFIWTIDGPAPPAPQA